MMIVIGEDNFHSIACSKCGLGTAGCGPLPDHVVSRLIEEGYIRQLTRKQADIADVNDFILKATHKRRTPQEIAGDLLEKFDMFFR